MRMGKPEIKVWKIEADMFHRGWNKRDLARAAHISESTLARFLAGQYQTAKTLKRISLALGQSPHHYLNDGAAA